MDLVGPIHVPVNGELHLVHAQDQLHISCAIQVFQYPHQLSPILLVWCLHPSGEERYCHLDITSCSVCRKEELVHCVVENFRLFLAQLPSVLLHFKKVVTHWCGTRSRNLLGEFLYNLPEVVSHVDPYFLCK